MRLNKYVALCGELSRRNADIAISEGRITVNGVKAVPGQNVTESDVVLLDGRKLTPKNEMMTILLHKPRGYVVSRNGQGSKTIYDLLPQSYKYLNPVGRLDKDSSGLLLLSNDGLLAQDLTHPSKEKLKVYRVKLDKPLQSSHQRAIHDKGVVLPDGLSKLRLKMIDRDDTCWLVMMHEGRNRQIRRTFAALGYTVLDLHRLSFGDFKLGNLKPGATKKVS